MRSSAGAMVDAAHSAISPHAGVPRSAFDVRWFHKTTFGASYLIPIYVDEVLPGDSHRVNCSALVRLAPMLVPPLDNLWLETFWFFVPNRLLWTHWENFMGSTNYGETTSYLTPYINMNAANTGPSALADYFGIPKPAGANTVEISAFPFRAYALIYNEWFRDQKLEAKVTFNTGDGPDNPGDVAVQYIKKRHDYFTSARPWPLAATNMQDTGTATMSGPTTPGADDRMTLSPVVNAYGAGAPVTGLGVASGATAGGSQAIKESFARTETYGATFKSTTAGQELYAYSWGANQLGIQVLIADIRMAAMIQRMLEIDARGGTRYSESIYAHFGVRSPDARLQRPELLGTGRTLVTMAPVAQVSASGATGTTTKMAQLAAHGYAAAHAHGFSASFTEHGWIMGLAAVRADLTYQSGVDRMWRRRTRAEFYVPSLAHLTEQAIMSSEVFADGSAGDQNVFGYQMRWEEYRWKPSRTSGYLRSQASTPLDMWHFGENISVRPSLNSTFVNDISVTSLSRNLQATAPYWAQLIGDFMFDVRYVRPMPMFSVPGVGARL